VLVADIDGYDLPLALYWILESRTVLRTQIDGCQHGKVVRQVVTTKDLREMCQNGVTLEDLRRLYGVDATLEDFELVLPSPLIGDLGLLPCREEAIQGLSECQEASLDAREEGMILSQDVIPLLSSMDQQPEMKAEVPSYYNPLLYTVPWYPLLVVYLLSQSSNALDVWLSLEMLLRLI
jgi:hypothetical protein